jgi:transcriptional regulator with XRE-family HTH domain
MGHLSQRLEKILADRQLSDRQAAARCGMPFESFRKILRGQSKRPRNSSLQQIADGLGVPMEILLRERARDADDLLGTPQVDDITTSEALQIAIARVGEIPEGELDEVRRQAEELLRAMQRDAGNPVGEG